MTNITYKELIQAITDANSPDSNENFGFFLGAGASIKSGIPMADTLCKKWLDVIKETNPEKAKDWLDENSLSEHYSDIFEARFKAHPATGDEALQQYINKATPSIGYIFLAQILKETKNKFVLTTNFDTMSEDALFLINSRPLVVGHELLASFLQTSNLTRPMIIKVHRDFLLKPKNSNSDTNSLDDEFKKMLNPILKETSLIVIGYGGNDNSVMDYIKENKDRKAIYWCYMAKDRLSEKVKDALTEKDFIVEIEGFDNFMFSLYSKLGCDSLFSQTDSKESKLVKDAESKVVEYQKQLSALFEKIPKENVSKEEEESIKKQMPSWWSYQLKVNNENDIEKKEKIYLDGLSQYKDSHELYGNYANFLKNIRKNYDEAEIYYKKSLELEPNDADYNGNYAGFLLSQNKATQADYYLKQAFEHLENENDLTIELWFYRLAHYSKYREDAITKLDDLLDKGIHSIGWDFSANIEQAKKDGFKPISLLEKYAKKISSPAS